MFKISEVYAENANVKGSLEIEKQEHKRSKDGKLSFCYLMSSTFQRFYLVIFLFFEYYIRL